MRSGSQSRWGWRCLAALVALGLLGLVRQDVRRDLSQVRDLHSVAYVGSAECLRCHGEHDASWRRTFHRTMTQVASPESVRGDFSGQSLDYFGARARMERGPRGEFLIRYAGPGLPERTFEVQKTVGSRRYQQYLGQQANELVRLPLAFDLEAGRWFHMNGAFLTADPDATQPLSQADYERHLTRWNDNCIFCHNVRPNPGRRSAGFESQVAELGVACEACHGPGAEHAERNQNPLRRFALHLGDGADPSIVNPARLSHERAADLCGRCHGQRITDDVGAFLSEGDRFIPGEDLALYSAPLWQDTTLHGEPGVFAARFWPDGTPRLTAYEYQGLLQSPCFQRGKLTCTSCHGMHEGDPRGQLREDKLGAAMCVSCHDALASPVAQRAHAKHGESPPACVDCHMPPIVYGVLSTHPSHRIEIPEPVRAATQGRPDACTLCHADQSRAWAVRESARLFGSEPTQAPGPVGSPAEPPASTWSEQETRLIAGDPIERALAARALAFAKGPASAPRARTRALLLDVMEHDPYPVVRRFAARSLHALSPALGPELARFVPETPAAERAALVARLKQSLELPELPQAELTALRSQASARAIDIGE